MAAVGMREEVGHGVDMPALFDIEQYAQEMFLYVKRLFTPPIHSYCPEPICVSVGSYRGRLFASRMIWPCGVRWNFRPTIMPYSCPSSATIDALAQRADARV